MKTNKILTLITGTIFSLISCAKFVTVDPPVTQLVSENVFTSDATAVSTITGTYSKMISSGGFASGGSSSITILSGLSADELINYSSDPNMTAFYKNALTASNTVLITFSWNEGYNLIYSANAILAGLASSTGMTDSVKKQLEGEARFIRSFCYFYLVNLYGDIPLITTTDYQKNALEVRMPVSKVYDSLIADLKIAQSLLSNDYSFSNGLRIRPNKWAATALLARIYLFMQNWSAAEQQASAIINQTGMYGLVPDLNSVFLANSEEAIWQLQPVLPNLNTNEGSVFILTDYPNQVSMSQTLIDSFEIGDNRRINWVDSIIVGAQVFYFPYKYKVKTNDDLTEYSMVMRLAEQYLIRAEARLNQNNFSGAEEDVNTIRSRAGLPNTTANDNISLMNAILHERQIELNTEWGHRWLDLKRTGLANQILSPIKGVDWQQTDTLYPISQKDISSDPNLTQNPGY
jgi:starch-binding outer membrane protein, SusD/RagB family